MAHQLLHGMERDWVRSRTNAFLIRDPREMLTSLFKVTPNPTVEDTGLPQQWALFEQLQRETGDAPPVLDAKDVLEDPRGMLTALCAAVEVPFREQMLSGEAGPRDTDGVWAPYWYGAVEKSTGFAPYTPKPDRVPPRLQEVYDACCVSYDKL